MSIFLPFSPIIILVLEFNIMLWWENMFINKTIDGKNNLCGTNVAKYRKALGISQRQLADKLQIIGLDVDKNAIQRIEAGQRFVTDIELTYLAKALNKKLQDMFADV